jgi:CBS domain containing-hemolysin-like protein
VAKNEPQESSQIVSKPVSAYDKQSRMGLAVKWFRHKVGRRGENSIKNILEEALEEESISDLAISQEERDLLKNMIHFGELTVRDIMVPRSDIMALPKQVSFDELKRHVIDIGHTRIPVYDDSLDHIEGFIHVKDLFPHLAKDEPFDISGVLRETLFVPPSMRIVDLLLKMRVSGCHIAIVVDEYGGTSGMVTMEDLFEEIVGEIQDEHDDAEDRNTPRRLSHDVLEVDARIEIGKLEEALSDTINRDDEDDFDTLGGYIFSPLGRVPVKGEVLKFHPRYKFEIIAADPRRIRLVRITKLADAA